VRATEGAAGVSHHVGVSIVGCERVPLGSFRVKADQERVVAQGPVPWSLVRATQFHGLVAATLAATGRWRVVPVPRVPLQTVASAEVARAVADIAEGAPRRRCIEGAGPDAADARQLACSWRSFTGRRSLLLPGALGRALGAGALPTDRADVRGTLSLAAWRTAREQ
jgi:hypothetical protein